MPSLQRLKRIPGIKALYFGLQTIRYTPRFFLDFLRFRSLTKKRSKRFSHYEFFPCLQDKTSTTGFDTHYIYHPAWAARRIAKHAPAKHVDISSTLHFCSLLSAFVPVEFYDYRPASLFLDHLTCQAADVTKLPFADNNIPSLSCMHVLEHIGLGRYGDAIDPDGDVKAMHELSRVLAPGGQLYIVVPVGQPCIAFNAHRIYHPKHIREAFSDLTLTSFSLIPDDAISRGLIHEADDKIVEAQTYGCGLFHFTKTHETQKTHHPLA